MKLRSIIWLCFVALTTNLMAQTPEIVNYQAIVRDINNTVVANQSVSVKFVITQSLPNGTVVYEENQSPTTNSHGLINLKIGTGVFIVGTLSAIDWGSDSYYLTTSIDPTGGTNYSLTGVSELVSVPYALHAKTVDDKDDADADPNNEIELPVGGTAGQVLETDGSGVYTWVNQTVDTDTQLDETAVDAFVANNGYLTTEIDGSITNEIELPVGGTNGQILKTNGSGVYAWVNQADDADADPTNEIELPTGGTNGQILKTNGSGVYTWVNQADDADADPTNEIELPTGGTNGQVLQTNGSGVYVWVNQTVDTDTDTQLDESAVDAFVANNGYLTTEVDGSITNEIQTLSISGSDLTISGTGGNTVTLPAAATPTFTIGQYHQGGIIVFIDSTGLGGLIVGETDLGTFPFKTGAQGNVVGSQSITDGKANTIALVAAGDHTAADECDAYSIAGFNDWYLPSYAEFIIIYNNLYSLDGFNISGFYWTSTFPIGLGTAGYAYGMSGAANLSLNTNTSATVRPIRKF